MFLKINFTDDEVEMLGGWSGQMSDGVGENKRWCNDYWQGLEFSNDGISVDETKRAFKNKSEEDVKIDILNRFIEITDEGMDFLGISELYFDGEKRDDTILGEKTANSIIEKLGGVDYKDYYEIDDPQELQRREEESQKEMDDLMDKINKGKLEMCNMLADMTGDESFRNNPDSLGMDVEEFEREMKKLGR